MVVKGLLTVNHAQPAPLGYTSQGARPAGAGGPRSGHHGRRCPLSLVPLQVINETQLREALPAGFENPISSQGTSCPTNNRNPHAHA